MSDVEPTSITFIIPVEDTDPSAPAVVSSTVLDTMEPTQSSDDAEVYFTNISKTNALVRYKFAFNFVNNTFLDKSSGIQYLIHDVVRLSTPLFSNVYCFRYYSTKDFSSPPTTDSDYEYAPIDGFLQDQSYVFPEKYQLVRRQKYEEFKC
jgi:hypothetical protein